LLPNNLNKKLNTIKFKLAIWFGTLIIISSLSTIFIFNYVISYGRTRPGMVFRSGLQETTSPISGSGNILFESRGPFLPEEVEVKIQQERNAVQQRVIWASAFTIAYQCIFATLSSYFVIKKLLAPLEELNKLMKEVNEQVLYTQIEFEGKSEEINELVTNFNEMMQRLEKAFEGQKQFVQNVSHEIKTPLTIIKTNLEALLFDETLSKDDLNTSIKTAINSINNLNNLTEDLLLLSLLDNKRIQQKQVKLQPLVTAVVDEHLNMATQKGIALVIEGETKRKVLANQTLLKRAFANVLENAVKYSPENTTIKIVLADESGNSIVRIIDSGEGIPENQIKKVFDRFFRADTSRSRKTGGSGLGLAITKEVVQLMHGNIRIENSKPGTRVSISLPSN
jgi:two-component system, OmpR family, sensor histidine kinase ArlS